MGESGGTYGADREVGYLDILPRQLVLASSCFALGTSLVVFGVDAALIALLIIGVMSLNFIDSRRKVICSIAIFMTAGVVNAQQKMPTASEHDISRYCGRRICIGGIVKEAKSFASGKGANLVVECRAVEGFSKPVNGIIQLTVFNRGKSVSVAPGDVVRARLCPFEISKNNSVRQKQLQLSLKRKGIFCQAKVRASALELTAHESASAPDVLQENLRSVLVSGHIRNLGEADGSLLASMVLGDKAVSLSKETSDSFRASGLTQILVASGFNLTIVAAAIYFVLRHFCANTWVSNLVCLFGMLSFVFVAGPSPSVVRAFLMGAILLLSRCLYRSAHLPAVLSFTMLAVLFCDPCAAADVGFQLSYFSTAGLVLGAGQITYALEKLSLRMPNWIGSTLVATVIAQACVLPLQLYYFKQFYLYCILANVVVSPMVAPITILGFSGSFCNLVETCLHIDHFVSTALDKVCFFPVELMRRMVLGIASWPLAQITTGQADITIVLLYYFILIAFPIFKLKEKTHVWIFLFAIALTLLVWSSIKVQD